MPLQRNSMLNRQGRIAWLATLSEEAIRGLANAWQMPDYKNEDLGRLRLHLSQIEGVEVPLSTERYQ